MTKRHQLVWVTRGSPGRPPRQPGHLRHVLGVLVRHRGQQVDVLLLQDDPFDLVGTWTHMYTQGYWSVSAIVLGPQQNEDGIAMCALPCPHHRVDGQSHGCEVGGWWQHRGASNPKPKPIPCPVWLKAVASHQVKHIQALLKAARSDE